MSQLTSEEWLSIFKEADELGISYILLAGGKPLLRGDIIEAAGKMQDIIFYVFTNGTYMYEKYFKLFDRCRNLIPVMSIEGEKKETDMRRGERIYEKLISNMDSLHENGLLFGGSVTVTTENVKEAVSVDFLDRLAGRGCKLVIYVEFVPVTEESRELAPNEEECEFLRNGIERPRREYPEMVFVL